MAEAIIGLIGVVVGALIVGAKEVWLDWRARRSKAQYLVVRVLSRLDRFVEESTEVVSDDGLYRGQPNAEGYAEIQVPEPHFDIDTLDVDWKAIPIDLMYRILSLPADIASANHYISGVFKYASDPPDYSEGFDERQYQYATIGLKAASIATELRSSYGLPDQTQGPWNPVAFLRERQNEIIQRRAARAEEHR